MCVECGTAWIPSDLDSWLVGFTDDEPRRGVLYCAACAAREFEDD